MADPDRLERFFPNLRPSEYEITSEESEEYNCLAWAAANDQSKHWEPSVGYYWPDANREHSIAGWIRALRHLDFAPCTDGALEAGFEKLAIYADGDMPTHVARQLQDGRWSSKIGVGWEDIAHTLDALTGNPTPDLPYGFVVQFLKRRVQKSQ